MKRSHNTESNRQKLARIIDSDEEDFEHDDRWNAAKKQLASHVENLIKMVAAKVNQGNSSTKYLPLNQELIGFGVPTRHRTYILGCNR